MVDFSKKRTGKAVEKPTDPFKLYDTLDREADKGPLRPAQIAVLADWFNKHQGDRDVIVKLHTGQGKTLTGLLMLQSRLNAGSGSVVYLCPNNYLVDQTREQARQFGIRTRASDAELPEDFQAARSIYVTSVQKLFNGLTKFGLNNQSVLVDTILMDDAHTCSDIIRGQCKIQIPNSEPAYKALKTLFAADIEAQGSGTFADIENDKRDAFLSVPYWAWLPREGEVATILSKNSDRKSIKFAWPLLKDMLPHCQCLISGQVVEIEPYIAPLLAFGSYFKAKHRIFMSATVTDDAFLVKGLQIHPRTIVNPLTYSKETWSGEKMILVPSLIHDDLDHSRMVTQFAASGSRRPYGRVALVPSFDKAKPWEKGGATLADGDSIGDVVGALKRGEFEKTVVLANRNDGIDLPDKACRILIADSKPYSESLVDLYQERCRPNSAATLMRTVRSIEQGMGRSVRGEKDYSVIIVIGADLVRLLRDKASRRFLSSQMATQIEIGLEITDMARQEIEEGKEPAAALIHLVNQCLVRDEDWKAFYVEKMGGVKPLGPDPKVLKIYAAELEAEQAYVAGDYVGAAQTLQNLLDEGTVDQDEVGWYLQEQGRFNWEKNRATSQIKQVAAHKKNRQLLKTPTGVTVSRLTIVSQGRTERIRHWISDHASYDNLNVSVTEILERLVFGAKAAKFEDALNELSRALGFVGERPDAEWKEGPDNLWALDDNQYMLFECKSEVDVTRADVNKREAEQMNRSSAWFEKHYPGLKVKRLMIHPAGKIESAAAFTHDVEGVREADLRRLVGAVRGFFKGFEAQNLKDLSESHIQTLLNAHELSVFDLLSKYSRRLRDLK
jgi:replicative superfamily II helicase